MYAIHWLLTNPLYSHHSTDSEVDTKHPQTRGGHHLNIQGETPATVCDTLGCNVHTHTRNEWPKWLCGEYECALVSIVRPFSWYTLYHYYWYAASYGTIRVNQVVRKRYQCFVWRLVLLSPSAATMKTLAPVAWKTCCECWQPDSGHNSSPNMTSMYIEHLPVNIWLDDI